MSGVDRAQAPSGGQWQALLAYPGKLAIGAHFDLAADQRGCITVVPFPTLPPFDSVSRELRRGVGYHPPSSSGWVCKGQAEVWG